MILCKTNETADVPKPDFNLTSLLEMISVNKGSGDSFIRSIPFSVLDVTAGAENEMQTVVIGDRKDVDLPLTIESSNFYKNMKMHADAGETSKKRILALESYFEGKRNNVWENSWVRFPERTLNRYARLIFNSDLKADKRDPKSGRREDSDQFFFTRKGEKYIRIPVSYMLKLALADLIGSKENLHPFIRVTGRKMMDHYSNDNTSPEIFSFHVVQKVSKSVGKEVARETLIRFLLTQLLVEYAQTKFLLSENGQTVKVYFSSTPPLMQKKLNDSISDAFYRDLFMSPCLSGWNMGEEKHKYMHQCHKVLSRSQINAVSKLKEAGIITSNLVILPNSSNISLANNGTHISVGSKKLTGLLSDKNSGYTEYHEKYYGDLVIKMKEHFLSLFPGTYSASPYRMTFEEFHPEKALGFLPHQIDYTHLRMIWKNWKKKAKIGVLGKSFTPKGPVKLDKITSLIFNLKGDYIPDFRLLDYFVALMSTYQSPSLNGDLGNDDALKRDLTQMGVFDANMPLYQLVRNRKYSVMGYTGFEHRYYSMFEDIEEDMGGAADLQTLLTALCWKYILKGEVDHRMIPDTPDVESERRQIFFCSAINLPSFYIKTKNSNLFLKSILKYTKKSRSSRRYSGYTKVYLKDYKNALLEKILRDGEDLIESFKLRNTISDLSMRLKFPETHSAGGKLVSGILKDEKNKNPMNLKGDRFNFMAEHYFIEDLNKKQTSDAFDIIFEEFKRLDLWARYREPSYGDAFSSVLNGEDPLNFLLRTSKEMEKGTIRQEDIRNLIFSLILLINNKTKIHER